jgi:hypothetical protein
MAAAFLILFASSLLVVVSSATVSAQQTARVGGNALKVSPVRVDINAEPGTTKKVEVFIQNLTSIPADLHVSMNDFTAGGDETGTPRVILDEDQYAPSHSLKQFMQPVGNITVAPGEQKSVMVTVAVPRNAAGGGYFGAIRFSPANPDGKKMVNLAASVGTLVLLRVNGEIKEDLKIASFDVRKKGSEGWFFTNNKDLTSVVRFENAGNVQLEPFGTAVIKRFGKPVSNFGINNKDPRGSVLPDSIRRFETKLKDLSAFGKYTIEGNFGYGSSGQLLTASTTFYVVPVALLIVGLIILLAILFCIFVLPKMIRAYNRNVIRKASRRK